jgi:hypothetical protein
MVLTSSTNGPKHADIQMWDDRRFLLKGNGVCAYMTPKRNCCTQQDIKISVSVSCNFHSIRDKVTTPYSKQAECNSEWNQRVQGFAICGPPMCFRSTFINLQDTGLYGGGAEANLHWGSAHPQWILSKEENIRSYLFASLVIYLYVSVSLSLACYCSLLCRHGYVHSSNHVGSSQEMC